MADTDNQSETAKPGDSQTTVTTSAPTTGNAVDQAEVERLRKEAEQARMRANQLEKAEEARLKAEEERKAKELEEQNEFKTLAEQEREKREKLEKDIEERDRREALNKAKSDTLKDYSDDVKEQAEDLGIDLLSDDESDVEAYKAKLDKIKASFENTGRVTSNNGQTRTNTPSRGEAIQAYIKGDKSAFDEQVANIPWVKDQQ